MAHISLPQLLPRFNYASFPSLDLKNEFKLISYNILANCWSWPKDYANVDPQHLSWEHRKPRLQEEILSFDADIVCLQEVDIDLFEDFKQVFEAKGYIALLQQDSKRAKTQKTANATLFKKDYSLQWSDHRSRALITGLKGAQHGQVVIIANMHLEGNPRKPEQRFFQIRSLLKQIKTWCTNQKQAIATTNVVICGDFNEDNTGSVSQLLSNGKLDKEFIDPLTKIKIATNNLQTEFKLQSAYLGQNVEPTFLHPCMTKAAIDFIYFSVPSISCVGVMKVIPENEIKEILNGGLPNKDHSSDHLPVGALLRFQR